MNPDSRDIPRQTDVAVIGAGPAGTVAAALLRKQGFEVVVIEKARFPRFVIGESLLPICMDLLQEAGLLEAVQTRRFQRKNGAIFRCRDTHELFEFGEQYTAGWDHTFQVPRAEFDQTLAQGAAAQGVHFLFEHSVQEVGFEDDGVQLRVVDGQGSNGAGPVEIRARFVLDASGPARVLARQLDLDTPSCLSSRIALFTHFEDASGLCSPSIDKVMAAIHPERRDVWYWGIPFADGRASVGVVAPAMDMDGSEQDPAACFRRWLLEEPFLAERLATAEPAFPVRRIDGYSASVKQLYGDRFALLGNSGEFLDPIFSSGVALAFKTASLAAAVTGRQLRHQRDEQEPAPDWESEFAVPVRQGLSTFTEFVKSWYDGTLQEILFHPAKSESIKRMICSILAGYAWDVSNPFVADTRGKLDKLHTVCTQMESA